MSRIAPILFVGTLSAACTDGFDSTLTLECPDGPIAAGAATSFDVVYTSFGPSDYLVTADLGSLEAMAASEGFDFQGEATNEDEPMRKTVSYTAPAAGGQETITVNNFDGLEPQCTFTVTAPDDPPVTLTVAVTGMGRVTGNAGGLDCPGTCTAELVPGTQVTLTPTPATDWVLDSVTGGCTMSGDDYVVVVDADTACAFTFVEDGPSVNQVVIPAGSFTRGCPDPASCAGFESPSNVVTLTAAYGIDRYEVTVGEYRACVTAGACTEPLDREPVPRLTCNYTEPDREMHPMNCVDWEQARAFCQWRGMDLPTEAQWERAARGDTDSRTYPWGEDIPTCALANITEIEPINRCNPMGSDPVGMHPEGASPFGVEDLIGNVAEWTLDWYSPSYYGEPASQVDPMGPATGTQHVTRGGSFQASAAAATLHSRVARLAPQASRYELGFRCASAQ